MSLTVAYPASPEPLFGAVVAGWFNYFTRVVGAPVAATAIDPELAENQLIFPNEETLSTAHIFRALSGAEEQKYQAQFQQILLGS